MLGLSLEKILKPLLILAFIPIHPIISRFIPNYSSAESVINSQIFNAFIL